MFMPLKPIHIKATHDKRGPPKHQPCHFTTQPAHQSSPCPETLSSQRPHLRLAFFDFNFKQPSADDSTKRRLILRCVRVFRASEGHWWGAARGPSLQGPPEAPPRPVLSNASLPTARELALWRLGPCESHQHTDIQAKT